MNMKKRRIAKLPPKSKRPKKGQLDPGFFTEKTYFCMKDMMSKQTTISMLEQYAGILVQWVQKESSLSIEQFCVEFGVGISTYYYWLTRSEILKEAHEYARMTIGVRRENKALNNELHPGIVAATLPSFLDRWQDALRFKETVKAEAQAKQSSAQFEKTFVIERFASDDRVPFKKEPPVEQS